MNYAIADYTKEIIRKIEADKAYRNLNNLYLYIQRGVIKLTRQVYNTLFRLLYGFETYDSMMFNWWVKEFQKLPGWLNV